MGISGAGKGTLMSHIRAMSNSVFHVPLSYTTREIRQNEVDGENYQFISREAFLTSIERGEFLEYALVHEKDYYGTKYHDVIVNGINAGKITIKEIDIYGLKKLKSEHPELDSVYSTVFLNIPVSKLQDRIETRGVFMSDEEYERRIASAKYEEEEIAKYCSYVIDATLSPIEVVDKFLDIVNKK